MRIRILFVDDDHRLRGALADYFQWVEGWEVVSAAGPAAAETELKRPNARFDLILLDIMMPPDGPVPAANSGNGLDTGLVLLDLLPKISPGTPVMILSARQDLQFTVDECKAAGYIRKTQTPEEIVEAIRAVVSPPSATTQAEETR